MNHSLPTSGEISIAFAQLRVCAAHDRSNSTATAGRAVSHRPYLDEMLIGILLLSLASVTLFPSISMGCAATQFTAAQYLTELAAGTMAKH